MGKVLNQSSLSKIPALAEKAVNKGHEVSVKLKVKVKPGRRYYGENK